MSSDLGPIENIFYGLPHRACRKFQHYFDIYERYLARYRDLPVRFLEIGIDQGGALDIWKRYFGPEARFIGVGIDPECKKFEDERTTIHTGDQNDPDFLSWLVQTVGGVDVIRDVGGSRVNQQALTFQHLYSALDAHGVYMCEDVHTSYDANSAEGASMDHAFIEYMKARIDDLHAWYNGASDPHGLSRSTLSLSFYNSIVILEKRPCSRPRYVEVGIGPVAI